MTNRVGLEVEGLTSVVRALTDMGVEVDDLKSAFAEIAAEGAQRASRHAPRRSGRLAADIRGNRAKSKAVVTAGRKSVPYAGAINYGWGSLASGYKHGRYRSKMRGAFPGTLFMQKADQEMQPIAIQRLEADINRIIKQKGLS